jgi:hypothetical protein
MSSLMLEPSDIKIAVAMCSHEYVPVTFAKDLADLCTFSTFNLPEGMHFGTMLIENTYIHSARRNMLYGLLQQGVTHILWLDTDMRFPKDSLIRLMQRKVPVIGINYAKRDVDTGFTAMKTVSWEPDGETKPLVTGKDSTGIEEVEALGFGMVLMRTAYLRNLPSLDDDPWFFFEWRAGRRQVGEDVYFCRLLKQMGVPIYVDHDLSKQCRHTGKIEYDCSMAEAAHQRNEEERRAKESNA